MFYYLAKYIVLFIIRIIFRIHIEGYENVPKSGPLIICPNHISFLDPPIIGALFNRRIYFMAKVELFKNPLFSFILSKGLGAFPVKRGTSDLTAIKTALKHLKKGHAIGIFPEGTRSKTGKLQKAEPGVSLLSVKGSAPVLPVGIKSNYRLFSKITIKIGKPIYFYEYKSSHLTSQDMTNIGEKIMMEISKLI
ncbi:lysophospholipid acyltransferase family protein [Thermoanaerobacterium sp. RBIITD]|uniref:lysophospholipid acyltransferase family protein n=1 Tax=Thermoanaerobacterium sp. RBIITD TaxID=1550240 RepID=UPI000BB6C283|nr:lysophospholipid acyltransferase family protein [Thermoanaerobacterium sp. RBIITD]SNX55423.1 1-acyl-sn-glycerol-3-phosphate acyltransferase [Thermoanaerobacterium sp. RBIITD]